MRSQTMLLDTIIRQKNDVATILTGLKKETSAGRKYDVKQETENLS